MDTSKLRSKREWEREEKLSLGIWTICMFGSSFFTLYKYKRGTKRPIKTKTKNWPSGQIFSHKFCWWGSGSHRTFYRSSGTLVAGGYRWTLMEWRPSPLTLPGRCRGGSTGSQHHHRMPGSQLSADASRGSWLGMERRGTGGRGQPTLGRQHTSRHAWRLSAPAHK